MHTHKTANVSNFASHLARNQSHQATHDNAQAWMFPIVLERKGRRTRMQIKTYETSAI